MNDLALQVENISKHYFLENTKGSQTTFAALNAISFTALKGELIGIIGKNGSGKSTLLKMLSNITKPTNGQIKIYGSIHSILDIGSNFHPDLTGLQNVKMSLTLQQLSPAQIEWLTAKIIAFSEIGDFINAPVKHYSNGMFLRLAFSVALNSNADILLLDEVMHVGDVEFKARSLSLVLDLAQSGKTVLVASHDIEEITKLCTRCIWLEKGSIKMDNTTDLVTTAYYQMYEPHLKQSRQSDLSKRTSDCQHEWSFDNEMVGYKIKIKTLQLQNEVNKIDLVTEQPISITITYEILDKDKQIIPLFAVHDGLNKPLFIASPTNNLNKEIFPDSRKLKVSFTIPANFFKEGTYYLSVGFEILNEPKESNTDLLMSSMLFPFQLHKKTPETIKILAEAGITPSFEWSAHASE